MINCISKFLETTGRYPEILRSIDWDKWDASIKSSCAYKNAGIDIPEEPKISGDSPEDRVQSFFQDKQFQENYKNDFSLVYTHDQNVRLAIAVWGLVSILLGVLMIWILDLVPYLFSLING